MGQADRVSCRINLANVALTRVRDTIFRGRSRTIFPCRAGVALPCFDAPFLTPTVDGKWCIDQRAVYSANTCSRPVTIGPQFRVK